MIKRERLQKLFGELVRKERNRQSITQSELAERANLDNTYISQIERGWQIQVSIVFIKFRDR